MSYALPDNIQNLTVGGADLYAAGNALDNLIKVDDSNDMTLYGAGGNNVLVGGAGTDIFLIDATSGSNAIYGWHSGDKLRLVDSPLKTFADIQGAMHQQGADVVFQSGQNHVVIRNTTVSQFSAADFDLPLDLSKLGAATFTDDFNSLSLRNAANPNGVWSPDYGYGTYTLAGNGELEIYTAPGFTGTTGHDLGLNPFSVGDGVLTIHAQQVDAATSAGMWNYGYSSGVITTKQSFSQLYGYFEMRAQLPTGVEGAWPAFWLVPADGSWPPELDVMETLSGSSNVDHVTAHTQASGSHTSVSSAAFVADPTAYHTYGVLWTPTTLTWYLDGLAVFQSATPADMNKPMYMIANMAVGGWAGTPDFTSADMKIDYIHAYALADGSGGSTSTGSGSTGAGSTGSTVGGSTATPTPPAAGSAVSTGDASYTAAAGVTDIALTGWGGQTVSGNDAGDTFTSTNGSGNHLVGGAGNDTFYLGRGGDIATGGGGTNTFVFKENPWAAGHITDFRGQDVLDLTALLARYGYHGSDAMADGVIKMLNNVHGGTDIWFNPGLLQAGETSWLLTTLDGITTANLSYANGKIVDPPAAPSAPLEISVGDSSYTAAAGVTAITLTGWGNQTVTGNNGGNTFTSSNGGGNHLTGGTGADTFILGRGGDVATGGAGHDAFVFNENPWTAGHITDFTPGQDTLDLTGLLARAGYSGSDPVGAGFVKITAAADGSAQVWSNQDAVDHSGWWLVTTLDGVAPSAVAMSGGVLQAPPVVAPEVSTGAASYVAPTGVTSITLTGWGNQAVTGNDSGDTFISSNGGGNHLAGGAGADTFILGRGGDVVTGGAGADTFVFNENPWTAGHITDFAPGSDSLDLTGLVQRAGYSGSDPVGAGFVKITAAADGSAQVWSNQDAVDHSGWWLVTTLDGVAPSAVAMSGDVLKAPVVSVSTGAASYAAPAGVTSIGLTGWGNQTVTGNDAGDTFTSTNGGGNHLFGGAGSDTFILGRGGDVVTGGAGHDTFVFNENPWTAGHITDFTPGMDTLDLTGLLARAGYTGSDPVGAGYARITAASDGSAQIWSNQDAVDHSGWWLVTTLDGVSASSVHAHGAFITG